MCIWLARGCVSLYQLSLWLEYVPNNIAGTAIYFFEPATHFFRVDKISKSI